MGEGAALEEGLTGGGGEGLGEESREMGVEYPGAGNDSDAGEDDMKERVVKTALPAQTVLFVSLGLYTCGTYDAADMTRTIVISRE